MAAGTAAGAGLPQPDSASSTTPSRTSGTDRALLRRDILLSVTVHPEAPVPARLFDDEREQRWRARFTAGRMSRPGWAEGAPDRSVYTSNASGTTEIYAWDRAADTHREVTTRRSGTHIAALPPDGEWIWWFADTDGDEFGRGVREPFAAPPSAGAEPEPALPGV